MIHQLKKKFIMINMLLVTLVLLIVFGIVLMFNYNRLRVESFGALERILVRDPGKAPEFSQIFKFDDQRSFEERSGNKPQKPMAFLPIFAFTITPEGVIENLMMENVTVSEEVVQSVAERVSPAIRSASAQEGVLLDLMLRYKTMPTATGVKIAFVDMSRELDDSLSLAGTLSLAGVAALMGFFTISVFLSRWALKPVEISWRQQKQFVADASHELKTPLTVILANVGILRNQADKTIASQMNWLDHTQTEAERMKALIDDLLFLAKSDGDQVPLVQAALNLSDLAWTTVLPFESVAFEQAVSFNYDIANDLSVMAELGQTRQLIAILLDNAIKYAGKNGEVSFKLSKASEGKVTMEVHNTGDWIKEEDQERIFDRFYRVDSSRVREHGGYGLGLAIAKSIVDRQGWKIQVRSGEEIGTTFTVWL